MADIDDGGAAVGVKGGRDFGLDEMKFGFGLGLRLARFVQTFVTPADTPMPKDVNDGDIDVDAVFSLVKFPEDELVGVE